MRNQSGCSAARLARFVRDEEAGGSNPLTPTIFHQSLRAARINHAVYRVAIRPTA